MHRPLAHRCIPYCLTSLPFDLLSSLSSSLLLPFLVLVIVPYPFLSLLPVVAPEELEIFSMNATQPYVVKNTWVENFIKFQYIYEAKIPRPRIVPAGCVPTNTVDGRILAIGDHVKEHDFVFSCEQDKDGVLSYEAIACVDALGNIMKIGEARKMSNGTVIMHCGIFGGTVKKVVEKASGCFFNNTIYGEDETWVEPIAEKKQRTMKPRDRTKKDVRLRGKLMQCFRPHYNYFESHLIGCVVSKFGIRIDEYAQVEKGVYVKCIEVDGGVDIELVHYEDLFCRYGNESVPEGSVWIDEDRASEYICSQGTVIKRNCVLGKDVVPLGKEVQIRNGCLFVCHPGANVYMCDKALDNTELVDDEQLLN